MPKHVSLDTMVADAIRDEILSGALPGSTHLVEAEFVKQFDVSHGTVRAALRRLEAEGLVESVPRRGVFVTELTARDVMEIYTLRDALEALAARDAAAKGSAGDKEELRHIYESIIEAVGAGDRMRCIELDLAFHEHIVKMSGHVRLERMYEQLRSQTMRFMKRTDPLHIELDHMIEIHRPIVEAICSGKADEAERLSGRHNANDGVELAKDFVQRRPAANQ